MTAPLAKPRADSLTDLIGAEELRRLVTLAIEEDLGDGDLTSSTAVPPGKRVSAKLVSKGEGVLAGLELFREAFLVCDESASIRLLKFDGQQVGPGDRVAEVEGDARAVLVAERTALNFLQQLSGVATLTAAYVKLAAGRARILDTRKTIPFLRALQKYAVICGGGYNHRIGLYDEAMIKDNHLDLAGQDLETLTREVRGRLGSDVPITSEARNEQEAKGAIRGGADVVLLDNMSSEEMTRLVPILRAEAGERRVELEASGAMTLGDVDAVAATGVDRISVGALTHSAKVLDLSLLVEVPS
ncbi:MAG: nicotinate-nucleotide pyrophosphorylase (carboxylating) [Bacteroidia bacterium]|jgi:nicotinate-nucleotide pyrophosphorylase (carboxylating)